MSTLPLGDLNERSRAIFREIVERYLETGEPVGSRTLSKALPLSLSPATIRNVMADLEGIGLLQAPHTSAGRMPTELGLRLFVDGLLEIGDLTSAERSSIEAQVAGQGRTLQDTLAEATKMLSGLCQCAGLVIAPKQDSPLKHVEVVPLNPARALVVMVSEAGDVENRLVNLPAGLPASALSEAANYLNARLRGRTIETARSEILEELRSKRAQLDELTARVVEDGLAVWSGKDGADVASAALIVRGQSHLLEDLKALEDLERIRMLFQDLERQEEVLRLLDLAKEADGVRIFIGSENQLFSMSGSALIVSPYQNAQQKILGVVGVIGPTRMNYARVIPMVDYTAKVVGRLLS